MSKPLCSPHYNMLTSGHIDPSDNIMKLGQCVTDKNITAMTLALMFTLAKSLEASPLPLPPSPSSFQLALPFCRIKEWHLKPKKKDDTCRKTRPHKT